MGVIPFIYDLRLTFYELRWVKKCMLRRKGVLFKALLL